MYNIIDAPANYINKLFITLTDRDNTVLRFENSLQISRAAGNNSSNLGVLIFSSQLGTDTFEGQ